MGKDRDAGANFYISLKISPQTISEKVKIGSEKGGEKETGNRR